MNVSLVVNPVAGNRAYRYVAKIESLLRKRVSLTTFITEKKGDAQAYAEEVPDTDLIIIASGDGTINEVINGLSSSEIPGQDKIPLALIPLGFTNVLAKELGISEEIEQAANLALTGVSQRISLGKINGRYFTLMAGIGFDGETVLGVKNNIIKKISGKGAHIISGLKVLKRYNPPAIKIKTSEGKFTGYTVIVGNARYYGGRFSVTPQASVTEPVLDICIFRGRRRRDLLRFVTGVIRKEHLSYGDVSYCKATEIAISSDGEVHIQIDGDYFGTLPANITVIPDAVSLVC